MTSFITIFRFFIHSHQDWTTLGVPLTPGHRRKTAISTSTLVLVLYCTVPVQMMTHSSQLHAPTSPPPSIPDCLYIIWFSPLSGGTPLVHILVWGPKNPKSKKGVLNMENHGSTVLVPLLLRALQLVVCDNAVFHINSVSFFQLFCGFLTGVSLFLMNPSNSQGNV